MTAGGRTGSRTKTATIALGLLILLLDHWNVSNRWQGSPITVVTIMIVVVAFFAGVYRIDYEERLSKQNAWFFDEAVAIRQHYASDDPKLVAYDDGIIAYFTCFPTMSGLGFALDPDAVESKTQGSLLSLAYTRGHTLIASFTYFNAKGLSHDTPSEVLKQRLGDSFFLSPEEVAPFIFRVDYLSPNGRFAIIRMDVQEWTAYHGRAVSSTCGRKYAYH